jgi:hypothetical protein
VPPLRALTLPDDIRSHPRFAQNVSYPLLSGDEIDDLEQDA